MDEYFLAIDERVVRIRVVDEKAGAKTVLAVICGQDEAVRVLPHAEQASQGDPFPGMPHGLRSFIETAAGATGKASLEQLQLDVSDLPPGPTSFSLETLAARTKLAIDSNQAVVRLTPDEARSWGWIGGPTSAEDGEVNPAVLQTVVQTYYSRGLSVNDRVREGAQRGYTIASAIAAALVAAGVFIDLEKRPVGVQVFGLVGLLFWLVAALAFIWVVGMPVSTTRDPDWNTEKKFVEGVAESTQKDLLALADRLKIAVLATVAATAITIGAFAWATADPGGAKPEKAALSLTQKADAALKSLCSRPIGTIQGTVDPDNLSDDSVPVTLPAGECQPGEIRIRLPKSSITAFERIKKFTNFVGLAQG